MLEFKKLQISDIPTLKPYFEMQSDRICDCSVVSVFMWRDYFETAYAIVNDTLIMRVRSVDGRIGFTCPLGKDISGALKLVGEYCCANDLRPEFYSVGESRVHYIEEAFGRIETDYDIDWMDYLYNAADHIDMPGKRFHKIKNRINRFKKLYPDYVFEKITPENLSAARVFFEGYSRHTDKESDTFREEEQKVFEVFDRYDEYGVFGALLKIGEKVIGMAMGEIVNDTLFVHIEKADVNYDGVYQVIVNEFAKMYAKDVQFINREEDCGDEGLRRSKQSYRPVDMLKKYSVKAKCYKCS